MAQKFPEPPFGGGVRMCPMRREGRPDVAVLNLNVIRNQLDEGAGAGYTARITATYAN